MHALRYLLILLLLAGGARADELPVFEGSLAARANIRHALRLAEGDFVHGRLDGAGLRLVLLDRDGAVARVLAKGTRDDQDFMFVAGDRGPYALEVRAPLAAAYRLALLRQVPRVRQRAPAQPDSPRLRALRVRLQAGAGSAAFWDEMRALGTPLVEHPPGMAPDRRLVTFLWRGARHGVRIHGGPSASHDEMARLDDSDVWFRSYTLPADTRLDYRLAPDVPEFAGSAQERRRAIMATMQRDPLNAHSFPARTMDIWDGSSVLELPDAPPHKWLDPVPGVATGSVEKTELRSAILGNTRTIHLYRSPGYRAGAAGHALVVLFDGEHYPDRLPAPAILDNLVAAGRLAPVAAILVANPSGAARAAELPPNPAFARFLAEELMPWARARGIHAPAARTVVAGASYGGLAAAYAGLVHPELFGKVYSQSGSFWWAPPGEQGEWLAQRFAEAPRREVAFLLEAGLFETSGGGSAGILDTTRHLRDVLRAKGYAVTQREFAAGHDFNHWRGVLGDGLAELLGTPQ